MASAYGLDSMSIQTRLAMLRGARRELRDVPVGALEVQVEAQLRQLHGGRAVETPGGHLVDDAPVLGHHLVSILDARQVLAQPCHEHRDALLLEGHRGGQGVLAAAHRA